VTTPHNPFYLRELPLAGPFCNRTREIDDLQGYARAKASVVLYSPRRFGKTSLVRRLQQQLAGDGTLTVFADFFGVTSVDDVARRLAWSVFAVTRPRERLFAKAVRFLRSFRPVLKPDETGGVTLSVEPAGTRHQGLALLEETLRSFEALVGELATPFHVALDEFQELTELPEPLAVEGVLRQHVQRLAGSFCFIGSRRRLLLDMFNQRRRPFYQSAINYQLGPIAAGEFAPFLQAQFAAQGRTCEPAAVAAVLAITGGHPYYTQKLCFFLFEQEPTRLTAALVPGALADLLTNEQPVFESTLQGLAPRQINLLRALASEPTSSVFAAPYMARHGLGSTGGIQGAVRRLTLLDLIERDPATKRWQVVDPLFRRWLAELDR
jgi:hypothetical protein